MSEEQVFLAALDLPDAAARAAYLDETCSADAEFRHQVEALLAAHFRTGEFLDVPAAEQVQAGSQNENTLTSSEDAVSVVQDREDESDDLTFLTPSSRPDSLGRLGHYEMLQVLGRGGFGIVFRASDDILQRVVAVKVMAPQIATLSPARKRFLREARSSAQVRHENVVQVYEVGEQPLPYLAMEFIPGETLQQRLDRTGPVEVPEVLRIGRQIAEGLAAAHACDLIHRDIKPGNILLEGGSHKAKITDFGLARAADDASISQSGVIAGTPMFMAPEQALGHHIDQRADLFSLGSVLYQMASGRPPFRAPSALAVLKRVAEESPRPIPEIIPETPDWLCAIIAKLHAKNPDERYQSAREIADVLADCETQLKAHAKLKDFSRIPQSKPVARAGGRWKWAAAVLLLPVLALALAEIAGITHLLPKQQPTPDLLQSGDRAKDNGPPTDFTNTLGMKFKLIPAGKFTMGSSQEEIDRCLKQLAGAWPNTHLPFEGPEHLVEITQPFYLGATEVTVGQFRQFVDEQGYQMGDGRWRNPGFAQTDQHPVVWVSWNNAVDFCKWLSKKEGKEYRLPTEAEWEYSCRAGKAGSRYGFGHDDAQLENYAWFIKNSRGGTHPVGKKKPNDWGLYDMHGNAGELCQDNFDPYYYKNSPVKDPPGGAGGTRAGRGGSCNHGPVVCRSAFRGYFAPDDRSNFCGFRVLLVSPPGGGRTESGEKDKPFRQTTTKKLSPTGTYALQFDGKGDYVDIPSLSYDGGPVTVEALVQVERRKLAPIVKGIGKEMIGTWLDETALGVSGGVRGTPFYSGLRPIELGHDLHHIAGVFDGVADMRLYLDGKSVGQPSRGLVNHPPGNGFAIGGEPRLRRGAAGAVFFAGIIHEVRISKAVRYDKDFTPVLRHKPDKETLALYHFDEGEGGILKDSSGNGHHGKIVSAKWVKADGSPLETKLATPPIPPFTDADVQRIAALPAEQQVEEVRRELKRRNPGFDGQMETKIEGGIVTEFRIVTDHITDIAPIRVFDGLRVLECTGTRTNNEPNGQLADLTPLKDMNLSALTYLVLWNTKVGDAGMAYFKDCNGLTGLGLNYTNVSDAGLVHFKNCKNLTRLGLEHTKVSDAGLANFKECKNLILIWLADAQVGDEGMAHFQDCKALIDLNLAGTKVSDVGLAHFKNCKNLTHLFLDRTQVGDAGLANFKGMRPTALNINATAITDLTPLQGMPLEHIRLTPKNITRGMDVLRNMKSLETIGLEWKHAWPAAEFWQRYDKGQFK